MGAYIERSVDPTLREALADSPVVVLNGPRQSGKSTLLAHLASTRSATALVSLDVSAERAAARADPEGYVLGLHARLGADTVALDEVQLAPELFRAVKLSVDQDRRPGRFVLAGSTRLLALPRLSDSLAGRMEVVDLWPLSQAELAGHRSGFLAAAFDNQLPTVTSTESRRDLIDRARAGGFAPALERTDQRREAWFANYVRAVVDRDLATLAALERLGQVPRLVALLAARTGGLVNLSELAGDASIPVRTLDTYLTWLERVFLVHRLPGWSSNRTTRARRAPKIHLTDSGVLSTYLDIDPDPIDGREVGPLLECFVAGELRRELAWSATDAELFHFRSRDGAEVDVVAEDRRGRIVGIEVKSSIGIDARSFRGLRYLQERQPDRFMTGVVLYCGEATLPFGPGLWAMPISALWTA